jgi:small conductance mechanosensitive channel
MNKILASLWALVFIGIVLSSSSFANESLPKVAPELKPIAVEEIISDKKIQQRLSAILAAVGSYEQVKVQAISGVIILSGLVDDDQQIKWAHDLAGRMDGVVAVQSQLKTRPKRILDLAPAGQEIEGFKVAFMRYLPTIVLALSVLTFSFFLFFLTSLGFRRALSNKIASPLLLNATAKILSVPVFFLGLYLALKISGLAGLAFTVLGGTGFLGLLLGLGLKNSVEDYAASILLSIKKPFRPSDWVKIGEYEGIVQKVTSRATVIIDFTGNHILIPNNIVYKSIITNMTANPKMRGNFVVGLDYGDSIEAAQLTVLELLARSNLVLKDPEPWVLVDELGVSAVKLKIYFWLNVRELSIFKVTSHLMLEVKNLLLAQGFRFPDPQREIVFTNQLSLKREMPAAKKRDVKPLVGKSLGPEEVRTESIELIRLAQESDLPDQGENLM